MMVVRIVVLVCSLVILAALSPHPCGNFFARGRVSCTTHVLVMYAGFYQTIASTLFDIHPMPILLGVAPPLRHFPRIPSEAPHHSLPHAASFPIPVHSLAATLFWRLTPLLQTTALSPIGDGQAPKAIPGRLRATPSKPRRSGFALILAFTPEDSRIPDTTQKNEGRANYRGKILLGCFIRHICIKLVKKTLEPNG